MQLAVQAATSSPRHTTFQALLTVQKEIANTTDMIDDDEKSAFNDRLSKIMAKLFARVIRAEEGTEEPYSTTSVDKNALILYLDAFLSECSASDPCYSMVQTLIASMLHERGMTSELRTLLEETGIDPQASAIGLMIREWEESFETTGQLRIDAAAASSSLAQPKTPSKDVAALVSRLGNAPEGEERRAALEAIKRFKQANGDEELRAHLQQLSGPFRDFIAEQLGKSSPSKPPLESGSVSDRIRSLRSRLQANSGSSVTTKTVDEPSSEPSAKKPAKIQSPSKPSGIPKSSPSKLPQPTSHSSLSLRERLAAQKPNRDQRETATNSTTGIPGSRAAALRARLEAVKQQANQTK